MKSSLYKPNVVTLSHAGSEIKFLWVPSHTGIYGEKIDDSLVETT